MHRKGHSLSSELSGAATGPPTKGLIAVRQAWMLELRLKAGASVRGLSGRGRLQRLLLQKLVA